MKNIKNFLLQLMVLGGLFSCEGFLEEKPQKSILVPNTLEDVRALLDNYTTLNENALMDFILADDWVTTTANWESLNPWEQNSYLWKSLVFEPTERSTDYSKFYRKIFTANVSLQALESLGPGTEVQSLKGEALFVRSMAYFQLAQLFLPSPKSGKDEIKIPVKLSPEVNLKAQWWSAMEVIQQVEMDLLESFELMPLNSQFKNRPNKKVAKAALARLYLYTEQWDKALEAANYVLEKESKNLLDYNLLDKNKAYPFTLFNGEVLYYGVTSSFSVTASSATFVNPNLTAKYAPTDLRKALFFTNSAQGSLFKGSYNGDYNLFTGIAIPEMYLTASEALIRKGNTQAGIAALTDLAKKRYQNMKDWEVELKKNPLALVLEERQKEQVFRGTRWMDIKRLIALGEFGNLPTRVIAGKNYNLSELKDQVVVLPSYEVELENR